MNADWIPQPGQRVLLTSDKDVWQGITTHMLPLLGTWQTVKTVLQRGSIRIKGADAFIWTRECVVDVRDPLPAHREIRMPEVGEEVLLTSDPTCWEGIVWDMYKYFGTVQTVSSVNPECETFRVNCGESWTWTPECIDEYVVGENDVIATDEEFLAFLGI